jgi:tRNA threonylcarbamoyl adenosine modification protein YeaZ
MIVLALDTTGSLCSAAVVQGDTVLASISEKIGRGHAERLAPMVQEVMAEAKVSADQIDRLAVCTGPGSFTGLRVALSYAKGFALPRNIPVVGLDALAATYLASDQHPQCAVVWTDVKRGQVMFGEYWGPGPLVKGFPKTGTMEAAKKLADLMQYDLIEAGPVDVGIIGVAAAKLPEGHLASYPAIPLYARAPDAKLPGGIDPVQERSSA